MARRVGRLSAGERQLAALPPCGHDREAIPPERLIVSSDCGFGRQGANRKIAFYKATSIAQGCNLVRRELGLPTTDVPAANAQLQLDVVQGARHRP